MASAGESSATSRPAADFDYAYGQYEYHRVALPLVLFVVSVSLNAVAIAVVHDYDRDEKPLSDIFLLVPEQRWAQIVANTCVGLCIGVTFVTVLFHRYRLLILSRVILMAGTMYALRFMSISVTHLPPSTTNETTNTLCDPVVQNPSFDVLFDRFLLVLFTFGSTEKVCGGLLFSGHTMSAILSTLVLRQYIPRRMLPLAYVHHTLVVVAVFCLVISRMHYTVDCLIAWWLTVAVFTLYHAVYEHHRRRRAGAHCGALFVVPCASAEGEPCAMINSSKHDTALDRFGLGRLVAFTERRLPVGKLPNTLHWPCSSPRWLHRALSWLSHADTYHIPAGTDDSEQSADGRRHSGSPMHRTGAGAGGGTAATAAAAAASAVSHTAVTELVDADVEAAEPSGGRPDFAQHSRDRHSR